MALQRSGIAALLTLYGTAVAAWLAILSLRRDLPLRVVLLLALAVRLALAFQPPLLSPDIHRYRWDGRLSLAGVNPYRFAPDDPRLGTFRDGSFAKIEHREIWSVYPPWAQVLFLVWAATGSKLIIWRIILLCADLAAIVVLYRVSPRASVAYATFPLLIFEGFWNGHVDAIAATLLLAACLAVNAIASGMLLGVAAGIKIIPIAALPALVHSRRWKFAGAFLLAAAVPVVIYAFAGAAMTGLPDYATRWSFNSPLFDALKWLIEAVQLDVRLKGLWSALKDPLQLEFISDGVYRRLYADFLARVALAAILVICVVAAVKRSRSELAAATHSVGLLILCSPTIHPWYWLPVVPLALASRQWFWIALAVFSPVSYLIYSGNLPAGVVYTIAYLPALLIAAAYRISDLRERDISRWIAFRGDSPS